MTDTTTVAGLEILEAEKERVWNALLKSAHADGKKLEQEYVSICRKIRRLKNPY